MGNAWRSRLSTLVTAQLGRATRVLGWVRGIGSGPESSRTGSWACSWLAGTPGDGRERAGALEESDIDPGDSPSGPCNKVFGGFGQLSLLPGFVYETRVAGRVVFCLGTEC